MFHRGEAIATRGLDTAYRSYVEITRNGPKVIQDDKRRKTVIAQTNKVWKKSIRKKVCLHPEAPANCSREFGKAHSVQKSKLEEIEEGRKVLHIQSHPMTGIPHVKDIGIRQASTFYGFCNYHDDQLFAPFEKRPLTLNRENALLLAFRGMSIHMYYKRRRKATDLFGNVSNHLVPSDLQGYDELTRSGLKRLLHFAEQTYDQMGKAILKRHFSNAYYYALILDRVPDILCSEASIINFGFDRSLVREKPQPYDFLTLSLLPYRQRSGIAIFAWHGKCKTNEKFLKSLMSLGKREVPDAIARFAFAYLNNFYFSPKWWRQLSEEKKCCLMNKAVNRTLIPDLTADGNKYVDWKIKEIMSSFKL